jgi:hypothetical protein
MKKVNVAKLDKRSGSLAYNRLDMQVSHVFHLAIELYDTSDYLLVLDHDDDITVYDNQFTHDLAKSSPYLCVNSLSYNQATDFLLAGLAAFI